MEMVLTDIQILGTIICFILSLVAYKVRIPSISIIPAIGLFVLGFQIYSASEDLLILGLYYFAAITQFVVCFGNGESRR